MKKICTFLLILAAPLAFFCQEVTMIPSVEKHSEKNEYKITAKYSGLVGAGIAKVKYSIPTGVHLFVPPNGSLNSSIKDGKLNFYAYSVESSGELTTVFVIGTDDISFNQNIRVMLQFNVGDERRDMLFDPISVSQEIALSEFSDDYSEYKVDFEEESIASSSESSTASSSSSSSSENAFVETTSSSNSGSTLRSHNNEGIESTSSSESESVVSSTKIETGTFTVQLLSLSNYDEKRIERFCKDHHISKSKLIKRNVDGMTKISIGNSLSMNEAQSLKRKMLEENQVEGAFVVKIN